MAKLADFRKGMYILWEGNLYLVLQFQHVKPGKGPAFIRTTLKGVTNKATIDKTFGAGESIVPVRVEKRTCQFSYQEASFYYFMDEQSFEMISLAEEKITYPRLLKAGEVVEILFREDTQEAIKCNLPATLFLKVTQTDIGTKGNTATKATKTATLETGAVLQVPLFINTGDLIKIDTKTGTYLGREQLR